jgi:hypothetical protein
LISSAEPSDTAGNIIKIKEVPEDVRAETFNN